MKKLFAGALAALLSFSAFAATTVPVTLINPTGSTAGQAIVSTGPTSAPAWGGVTVGGIAAIAANTVLANATGSSAAPTAFTMPSCSASNSALQWASGTGFICGTTFAKTGNPLSQFAATTSAQLLGVISDETGSGALVFGTSPTIATPTITGGTINGTPIGGTTPSTGAFTTLSATGLITPVYPAGIKGNITGSAVTAGSVGERPTPGSGVNVSMTSGAPANVASISLTAGDWDVCGNIYFLPAGTTVIQSMLAGLSTTTATLPGSTTGNLSQLNITLAASAPGSLIAPCQPFNVSSTTTVFLVGQTVFNTSTLTASGLIWARRR